MKRWNMAGVVALMVLVLTGQGCPLLLQRPEQEPLTGSRAELEKDLPNILPDNMAVAVRAYFEHTKPGEYSDLFAVFTTLAGANIAAEWSGPCLADKKPTSGVADDKGMLKINKRILCFGDYEVKGTVSKDGVSKSFDEKVKVE